MVELTAAHPTVLLAQLRDLLQHIVLALFAAPLPRVVLVIRLPAKPKYATDPPQAKVRTAYSQELDYLVTDFFSMLRPSSCSATRITFL
ncbi:hypothetical protein GCM10027175_39300 [Hymenobacter latericoloratus]